MSDTPENDDIFGKSDTDDGLRDMLNTMMDADEEATGDTDEGGLDQPISEDDLPETELVREEEARKILSDADLGKTPEKKAEAKDDEAADDDDKPEASGKKAAADTTAGTDKAKDGDTDDGTDDDAKSQDTPDLTAATPQDLLEGVPDDRRNELMRRLGEADTALAPFKSPYIQAQIKQFGSTPAQVSQRLVQLATFANSNPAEYIAWVINESSTAEKRGELLQSIGQHLGVKLTAAADDDDDDDLFEDPETKRLKARIAELEAGTAASGPTFGPDTPARRQQQQAMDSLNAFQNERDDTGALKRPLYDQMKFRMAELARERVQQTGQPVQIADLQGFYDRAVQEVNAAIGQPPQPSAMQTDQPSAAQTTESVADQIKKKKADAAAKARRASTTLDGAGHGSSRRPEIKKDVPLEKAISQIWDGLSE